MRNPGTPDLGELIEQIKRDLDIRHLLPPESEGRRSIRCPLPDHEDHHPSFSVYPETNSWVCWSHPGGRCGGSVLDYLMAERGIDFSEALQIGADLLGLELRPLSAEQQQALVHARKREDLLTTIAKVACGHLLGNSSDAQSAREYLHGRGVTEGFMREHLLGLLDIDQLFQLATTHPLLAHFPDKELEEAGLRWQEGAIWKQLYHGKRLAIPLLRWQRVMGFTFRSLAQGEKRFKYVHLRGSAGLYNEDALAHQEVFLTEGVPDCWTLMGWGLSAVGNLGVYATKHAHKFSRMRRVTLVWDNDEAGRSAVLKSARAIQAQMPEGEVRILHLLDHKDINVMAQAGGTREEFCEQADRAPTLVKYLIDRLPDLDAAASMTQADEEELEEVLRLIAGMKKSRQTPLLRLLRAKLNTDITSLRSDMKALSMKEERSPKYTSTTPFLQTPTARDLLFEDVSPVIAALSYTTRGPVQKANVGVWIRTLVDGQPGEPLQYLVDVEIREGVPAARLVPYLERQLDDPKQLRFPDRDLPRWSISRKQEYSVPRFVEAPEKHMPNTALLFAEIRQLIKDYVWYPNEYEYDVVAAWIMMTYLYPVFRSVGFLHFHGMKSAGKSLSLGFVDQLAFNPRKMESATEAVLFRSVHNNRATLILDEAEKFNHPKPGTPEASQRLLLNGSYKYDAQAMRMNMELGQVETFSTFSPKCFGSINEIDHVLGDRCIVIKCLKIRDEDKGRCLDSAQTSFQLEDRACHLRNRLHCWALTRFPTADKAYREDLLHAAPTLMAREREVWLPLLVIAHMVDLENPLEEEERLFDQLLKTQQIKLREKQEKEKRENIDLIVIQALLNLVAHEDQRRGLELMNYPNEYSAAKLATTIHEELVEEGTWPFERRLTSNRLTALLKTTNIVEECDLRRRHEGGKRVRTIRVTEARIVEALHRLKGFEDDEESDSQEAQEPVIQQAAPRSVQGTVRWSEGDPF